MKKNIGEVLRIPWASAERPTKWHFAIIEAINGNIPKVLAFATIILDPGQGQVTKIMYILLRSASVTFPCQGLLVHKSKQNTCMICNVVLGKVTLSQ